MDFDRIHSTAVSQIVSPKQKLKVQEFQTRMNVTLLRIPTIIDASDSTTPICPPIGLAYVKSVVKKFTENITVVDSVGNHPHTRTVRSDQHSIKLLGQTTEEVTD